VVRDQTVPYGTDSRLDAFQAINCLATIISPFGTTNRQTFPQNLRHITQHAYDRGRGRYDAPPNS
jgi:hypothetical protein